MEKELFELERFETINAIRRHIQGCEGSHIQQVVYSTYHDALTQICFGCKKIRTNLEEPKPDTTSAYLPANELNNVLNDKTVSLEDEFMLKFKYLNEFSTWEVWNWILSHAKELGELV